MSDPADLDQLNPAQRAAVLHAAPLLILAGAGTGKTNTLAHRVAYLLRGGVDPRRILLLTFTRRAAEAMARRAERLAGLALGDAGAMRYLEWAGTFHAIGARLLRDYADCIGLDPGFSILDRSDAADLLDLVRDGLGLARSDRRFPKKGTCLAIYSLAVNARLPLADALQRQFPWCAPWREELGGLFEAYVAAKQSQGVLDYDDLLLWWERMLEVRELAADLGCRFDHVLVDEYQDTNALQAAILRRLKPDGRGLAVVGDDAQAIYSFRAATVRNILDFPGLFDPPAAMVRLEQNYRSTEPILKAANAVIGLAREGHRKGLFSHRRSAQRPVLALVRDELAQAEHVAAAVLANREAGMKLCDQAVLFRASSHSAAVELELARREIPFVKYGGLRFLEAAHVKDMLALLRWAANPRDEVAGFRSLQLLPGIGPGTARRALAASANGIAALAVFRPPPAAAELWPELMALLGALAQAPWPVQPGLVRGFYDPLIEDLYDFAAMRRADLDQLERLAAAAPTRERFLTELALDPPEVGGGPAGSPQRDEDYLILSTIHSAKGQEWKAVLVLNLVDGCIPSDMATDSQDSIEEERRLLYVAMTRARDQLTLVQPERFYLTAQARHGDRYVRAPRSRFLPPSVLPWFEIVVAGSHAAPPAMAPRVPRVDIASGLKAMWK